MKKILIIGCTEITKVLVPALMKEKGITDICVTSKIKEEADEYRRKYQGAPVRVMSAGVDVTAEDKALLMMSIFGPNLIINLAPSHLNKKVMEIALKIGASYLDTAYYTDATGKTCLIGEQFDLSSQFYAKKAMAVTGCSFNPAAYICLARTITNQKLLDTIEFCDLIRIDVMKSNAGEPMPSVSDLYMLHKEGRSIVNGKITTFEALKYKTTKNFPGIGKRTLYAFDNPVIDSFKNEIPEIKTVRYFSSLKKQYMTLVNTLNKIGMLSSKQISVKGVNISPIEFLESLMPKAEEVAKTNKGTVNIAICASGKKDGEDKSVLLHLICDQAASFSEYGVSAVGLMSAMTTLAGVTLLRNGKWNNPGVFTAGDYDPELLLDKLKELGIEYAITMDVDPIVIEENEEDTDE